MCPLQSYAASGNRLDDSSITVPYIPRLKLNIIFVPLCLTLKAIPRSEICIYAYIYTRICIYRNIYTLMLPLSVTLPGINVHISLWRLIPTAMRKSATTYVHITCKCGHGPSLRCAETCERIAAVPGLGRDILNTV
jgi:hypothetical protein